MTHRKFLRLIVFPAVLLASAPPATAQPPRDQETDLPGVTARLLSVKPQDDVLIVSIALSNTGSAEATSPKPLDFSQFVLIDGVAGTKHFPLKDLNGHYMAGPISDWNGGGRWFPRVPPGGARTVWAMFGSLKAGVKATIQAPLLPPFDDVDLAAVAARPPADDGIPHGGLTGTVVSAVRANDQLKVRVKIVRAASGFVETAGLKYSEVSLLDPATRRQYWLLKDQDGNWLAQPISDKGEGGRFFLSSIPANGQIFMNLAFTAPPDTVRHALLLLPYFAPSEVLEIQGTAGAAESGTDAAGRLDRP